MTPEQRAIAIVDAAEKCKCDYLAETFCNKCGHSHGRTGCDWRRISGLWVSPTVAVAAIAAALMPSEAVKLLITLFISASKGIHGELCGGDEWEDCTDERRCATDRAAITTVREELGL